MAEQITSDNFERYFLEMMTQHGADAKSDYVSDGGIEDILAGGIDNVFRMLLLDNTIGQEVWKKASLSEVAKKLDIIMAVMHDAEVVSELPQASAETMRRIFMIPALRATSAMWDWANGIPTAVRDVVIQGPDAQGTIPGDNGNYALVVGPETTGNYVSFSVVHSSDGFVTIGSGVVLMLTAQAAGDVLDITFVDGTSAYCKLGDVQIAGDNYTHIITAEEATAGYIRFTTTGTVKIASINATYSGTNAATGYDPQHTLYDKYITVTAMSGNDVVYRWEQIGSAYTDMSGFYNKSEIGSLLSVLSGSINAVEKVIPGAATVENPLADKAFVEDRIETCSATHQGTYNVVIDLGLAYNATKAQVEAKLNIPASEEGAVESKIVPGAKLNEVVNKNDFVLIEFPSSPNMLDDVQRIDRYKFNDTAWAFEYSLNSGGHTATIAIGSTTTLAPGQPATVFNSGTEGAAVFNFGIPRGATGQKGDKGDKGDNLDYSTMTTEEKSELNDTVVQHIVNENILGPTYDDQEHGFNFPKAMHVQYDAVEHGFNL